MLESSAQGHIRIGPQVRVDGVGGPHCPALWEPPPTPNQGQTEAMEYPSAFLGEGW